MVFLASKKADKKLMGSIPNFRLSVIFLICLIFLN